MPGIKRDSIARPAKLMCSARRTSTRSKRPTSLVPTGKRTASPRLLRTGHPAHPGQRLALTGLRRGGAGVRLRSRGFRRFRRLELPPLLRAAAPGRHGPIPVTRPARARGTRPLAALTLSASRQAPLGSGRRSRGTARPDMLSRAARRGTGRRSTGTGSASRRAGRSRVTGRRACRVESARRRRRRSLWGRSRGQWPRRCWRHCRPEVPRPWLSARR